jgi:hypothetical protein
MNASNVVLLEHINLNLSPGRLPEARRLFLDACGFVEDPRPSERGRIDSLLWVNCGLQQVHLPIDPSSEFTRVDRYIVRATHPSLAPTLQRRGHMPRRLAR